MCKFHDGEDCTKAMVNVESRSDDYDVTIACKHQEEKPKICIECGEEFDGGHFSSICSICLSDY